jgi:hypothetical protein
LGFGAKYIVGIIFGRLLLISLWIRRNWN